MCYRQDFSLIHLDILFSEVVRIYFFNNNTHLYNIVVVNNVCNSKNIIIVGCQLPGQRQF